MTVNDLITAALRRLRVVAGSDPPNGDDLNDALARFNDWIDDLKNNDFLDLFEQRVTWPIVPGKASYTVGVGGTPAFDVQTPVVPSANDIHNIGYVNTAINPSYDYLLSPPLSEDGWASVPQKTLTSAFPYYWYYNASGLLYPWPVPTSPSLLGVLYIGQTLAEMTINTVLNLPPGYRRFLRDGLAVELAPEFHVSDQMVIGPLRASAEEAMRNIKRKKKRPLLVLTPPAEFAIFGRDRSNIYTGP